MAAEGNTIYLDNAATTRCDPEAAQLVMQMLTREYGNPSSLHAMGFRAEQQVERARAQVAGLLKSDPKEILFTSGATESNNLAVIGGAVAGATVGLLLAPEKGEKTREDIVEYLKSKGIKLRKSKIEALADEIAEEMDKKL